MNGRGQQKVRLAGKWRWLRVIGGEALQTSLKGACGVSRAYVDGRHMNLG